MPLTRLHGCLALLLTLLVALAAADEAAADRTVYFADPASDVLAQFDVGPGGALTPLEPSTIPGPDARRLAMTPAGSDLYAAAGSAILQYDVANDGGLTAKSPPSLAIDGFAHSIAIHPDGGSVYVTDQARELVRQFDVGSGGRLEPKDPATVHAGDDPTGLAVSPDGLTAYVLVAGGIAVFDVGDDGALSRRDGGTAVGSGQLQDLALTPNGHNLYVTSLDGRVLQFSVGADGTPHPKSPAAAEVKSGAAPVGIAITPDGSAAYVASRGWAAGGARHVFSFAIEPDGRLSGQGIASAGARPFKLWYLTTSPDGESLFVAGGDGHLFDLAAGAAIPKLPSFVDLWSAVGVVVSPNQSPVASFTVEQPTAGTPVQFDASSTGDVDGTVVRYDWDFGDGHVALDAGPTPTHTYTEPGTYIVRLVVTDNEGASTTTIFTGGTVLGHGTPSAETSRPIEVLPPAPVPAQTPQDPLPDLGETLVAEPHSGTVRVRVRGTKRFRPLAAISELPLGSTLDARRGRVTVSTIRDRRNKIQEGVFDSGVFTVRQSARQHFVTELVLRGTFGPCATSGARSSARSRRRLWGSGRGRFRSRGNNSSATVRGTIWLTEDRCDGTLTKVRRGRVVVRDFASGEKVVLERGERYLAESG